MLGVASSLAKSVLVVIFIWEFLYASKIRLFYIFNILWYNISYGALAQLIERSIRIAEVAGLIPARSTKFLNTRYGEFEGYFFDFISEEGEGFSVVAL